MGMFFYLAVILLFVIVPTVFFLDGGYGVLASLFLLMAALPPFLLVMLAGGPYIRFLQRRYLGQFIREDGPESHQSKKGTPTAGGVLILAGMLLGVLTYFFAVPLILPFEAPATWPGEDWWLFLVVPVATLLLGLLGFWDDFVKIAKKHNKGVTGYTKLAIQMLVGLGVGYAVYLTSHISEVSFFNLYIFDFGPFYPFFAMFVIVCASNAVNLTDGLDGLASGTVICTLAGIALLSFMGASNPLPVLNSPQILMNNLFISLSLIGATLGFLYFNKNPAKVFMGDCGSLALGGAVGALTVMGHCEFWLVLMGGVFVMETFSVILQVLSFKTTGKRIFKMSPIHHHFELCGWHETKVVKVFTLVQFLLCALVLYLYSLG